MMLFRAGFKNNRWIWWGWSMAPQNSTSNKCFLRITFKPLIHFLIHILFFLYKYKLSFAYEYNCPKIKLIEWTCNQKAYLLIPTGWFNLGLLKNYLKNFWIWEAVIADSKKITTETTRNVQNRFHFCVNK